MEFSRQEYWSGCHSLLPEISPPQGTTEQIHTIIYCGLYPQWDFLVAETVKHLPTMPETPGSILRLGRSLGEGNGTHSSSLARKFHGWRSLVGYSPRVAKSRTRLSDFTFFLSLYPQWNTTQQLKYVKYTTRRTNLIHMVLNKGNHKQLSLFMFYSCIFMQAKLRQTYSMVMEVRMVVNIWGLLIEK